MELMKIPQSMIDRFLASMERIDLVSEKALELVRDVRENGIVITIKPGSRVVLTEQKVK